MKKEDIRYCLLCESIIKGRSDKKFCNDYCRNAYNNELNASYNVHINEVNAVLKKNRKIIAQLIPADEKTTIITRDRMLEKGFDFNYFTQILQTQKGNYIFNYEYGYLIIDNGNACLLVKKK
jgi:predicted nucleic acid-binding Zn ribbon protein